MSSSSSNDSERFPLIDAHLYADAGHVKEIIVGACTPGPESCIHSVRLGYCNPSASASSSLTWKDYGCYDGISILKLHTRNGLTVPEHFSKYEEIQTRQNRPKRKYNKYTSLSSSLSSSSSSSSSSAAAATMATPIKQEDLKERHKRERIQRVLEEEAKRRRVSDKKKKKNQKKKKKKKEGDGEESEDEEEEEEEEDSDGDDEDPFLKLAVKLHSTDRNTAPNAAASASSSSITRKRKRDSSDNESEEEEEEEEEATTTVTPQDNVTAFANSVNQWAFRNSAKQQQQTKEEEGREGEDNPIQLIMRPPPPPPPLKKLPITSVSGSAIPKLNMKNKKRSKIHIPTDEPYDLTVMNVVTKFQHYLGPNGEQALYDSRYHLWSQYTPRTYPAASVPVKCPRGVVSIYRTNQCGIAGSTSVWAALVNATLLSYRSAQAAGVRFHMSAFGAVNFTASAYIGIPINLERFYQDTADDPNLVVTYNKDNIDALHLRFLKPNGERHKITAVLFEPGRICVVGMASEEEAECARRYLIPVIRESAERYQREAAQQKQQQSLSLTSAASSSPSPIVAAATALTSDDATSVFI